MMSNSSSQELLHHGAELLSQGPIMRSADSSRDFVTNDGRRVEMDQVVNVIHENRRMKQLLVCQ